MLNKKVLLCGVAIALSARFADAADQESLMPATGSQRTLFNMLLEVKAQKKIEALKNSCPARFTETGCPLIVPVVGYLMRIPVYECCMQQCAYNQFKPLHGPLPNEECAFLAGGILWVGTYFCLIRRVEKKIMSV